MSHIFRKSLLSSAAHALLVGTLFGATLAPAVAAEEAPADAEAAAPVDSDIVIVGTRRSGVDTLDAAAPVDVISGDELAKSGAEDLAGALRKLSPSFTMPSTPTGGFASSIPVGAALRGFSGDQVLVLINGKRRHTGANFTRQNLNGGRGSAAVDLSLIPVSAIARIEILRDGAAAQYGSDAIAGVINVVLRSNEDGGNVSYRFSEFEKYGGQQHQVNAWKGFALPGGGFLDFAFSYTDRALANNTDPDSRRFYNQILVGGKLVDDPREATSPYRNWPFGSPAVKNHATLALNTEVQISDKATFYSFVTWGMKDTTGLNFYEFPNSTALLNKSSYFQARFPDGRIPVDLYYSRDFAADAGVRIGNVKDGQWDISANYGRNWLNSRQDNAINPSYGADSPYNFDSGTRINTQINAAIDYVRELDVGFLPRALTISAGAAYRREDFQLIAGDPVAYTRGPFYNLDPAKGAIVPALTIGITDQDARKIGRDVFGGYISVEGNFAKWLEFGLAGRVENYSDFGTTVNVKGSLRFVVSDSLALRTSAGTGYRAPSLVQSGFSAYSFQTDSSSGVPVDVLQRTLIADSDAARLLGGKALTPEKSTNISAGFVWRPVQHGSITVDAYQIVVKNGIELSENLTKVSGALKAFVGTQYESISSAAFFTNVLDTRTRGVEASANYEIATGVTGKLKFNIGYAYNRTEITKARDSVNAQGVVIPSIQIIGRVSRGNIEEGTPRSKLVGGIGWSNDNFNVNVNARRYGTWSALVATPSTTSRDQTFSPQTVTDIDLGYRFGGALSRLKLTAGVQNVFETYPDYIYARGASVTKYSYNSPEGSYGRLFYTSLSFDL